MSSKKIMVTNGVVSLISQLLMLVIEFITRTILLRYIGIEIIGISTTITSVISTLSLTELGIQTAIVYHLYKPLKERDYTKVNQILHILKCLYNFIGMVFGILSVLSIPLLKYILKEITITPQVLIIYLLMSLNTMFTYFIAYRRILLYADRQEYITKIIDSLSNLCFSIIKLYVVISCNDYVCFLIIQLVQTQSSNIVINLICKKKYSFLKKCRLNTSLLKKIAKDIKNVLWAKIAGYVYGVTDNIIVSSMLGAVQVGFFSNYTILTSAIRNTINMIFSTMTPIIGNMLIESTDSKKKKHDFDIYSYVRYGLAVVIIPPWIVLSDNVVTIMFGQVYVMDSRITILLGIDLYIHIVHSACCNYIDGSGSFKWNKKISFVGTIINLVVSILCVKHWGVAGVLIGTVISQFFFWISRAYVVFCHIFESDKIELVKYFGENIFRIIVLGVSIWISLTIQDFFKIDNIYVESIIMFVNIELVAFLIHILVYKNEFMNVLRSLIRMRK